MEGTARRGLMTSFTSDTGKYQSTKSTKLNGIATFLSSLDLGWSLERGGESGGPSSILPAQNRIYWGKEAEEGKQIKMQIINLQKL